MHRLANILVAVAAVAGCSMDEAASDRRDASFTSPDGKLDGFSCSPAEAAAILEVVNTMSAADLVSDVQLAQNAADAIVAVRIGDDEAAGTADDERFDTLPELDAVPYIGPVAFGKLLDYVQSANLVGNAPQWHMQTIGTGYALHLAPSPGGGAATLLNTPSATLRLANGTLVALPAGATRPSLAIDGSGTPHLFYSTAVSAAPHVYKHASYRNGSWTEHGTITADHLTIDQSPDGAIYGLTTKDPQAPSSFTAHTLVTFAPNGTHTVEPLWSTREARSKSFAVGNDGFPTFTYWHEDGVTSRYRHARRGPNGWSSFDLDASINGGNISSTGGEQTVLFMKDSGLDVYRQQAGTFVREANLPGVYPLTISSAVDSLGTSHACFQSSGNMIHVTVDTAGSLESRNLGNGEYCRIAADNTGKVHMIVSLGNVLNYGTFE